MSIKRIFDFHGGGFTPYHSDCLSVMYLSGSPLSLNRSLTRSHTHILTRGVPCSQLTPREPPLMIAFALGAAMNQSINPAMYQPIGRASRLR